MLDIPYEKNPGSACALCCYSMTARYFFPEMTFQEIAEISGWRPGYVVWGFKFWKWIMDKGIKITDYDLIDIKKWAEQGIEGLRQSISKKEFDFLMANTKDIEEYSEDIKEILRHPNFTYKRQKSDWNDLIKAYNNGAVCEVVLNSQALDGKDGFSLHRVVVLEINDRDIIFHDPRKKPRPARKESIDLFQKAWLAGEGAELCIYEKN